MSRVGFLWARCWLDADGRHVWLYHRCADGEQVTMLPWPTWQAVGEDVQPSIACGACELHFFAKIGDPMAPALIVEIRRLRAARIGGGQ